MHQKILIRTHLVLAESISHVYVIVVSLLLGIRCREIVLLFSLNIVVAVSQLLLRNHLICIVRVRILLDAS